MNQGLPSDILAQATPTEDGLDLPIPVLREAVLHAMLTGSTLRSLQRSLEQANISVSYDRIVRAKAAVKEMWAASQKKKIDYYFTQELDRLEVTERVAWDQYFKAGGEPVESETLTHYNKDGKELSSSTKEIRNNKVAAQWFDRILKVQEERRKLLGLEQTVIFKQTNISDNRKAYIGIDPESDWPKPGQTIPMVKRTVDHYDE